MSLRRPASISIAAASWVVALMLFFAACSSSGDDADSVLASTTTSSEAPTTTRINRPPEFRELPRARAELGQTLTDAIVVSDPDGDTVVVRMGDAPVGFTPTLSARGTITGFEWQPLEPGVWSVEFEATDPSGASTTAVLDVIARAPRETSLVLSLGDSFAAGYGRDRSDFLGRDDCFRSEGDAYVVAATDILVEAGALDDDTEVRLAGCLGATVDSLDAVVVQATSRSGEPRGDPVTQIEMARQLNPTIITMTVGGSTAGLFDVERLFLPSPGDGSARELDQETVAATQDLLEDRLREVLVELLRTTDAHIAVTTYYDPTAMEPVGVEGCREDCFAASMGQVVDALNTAIVTAAEATSLDRISVVHLDGDADVWEAANGLGPDFLRDRLGPLQGLVDQVTGGSTATCADRGEPELDLVSVLDCIHPNTDGHELIGELVAATLLSI